MNVRVAAPMTESGISPSDAVLVEAARAGQRAAREALFRRHAPRLLALAFRMMGRDDEIEDIVQDAFIQGFEGLTKLRDATSFASWIGTIVVRQARRRIRRRRLLARLGLSSVQPIDPDTMIANGASPEKALELRRLYVAIERMPAEVRLALVLHRVEGLALAETADALGLSLATTKRRIAEGERIARQGIADE